jgi:DNA-binding CsgD family transcriptional regulator/tetratricopeptide (TPR) repeat protein
MGRVVVRVSSPTFVGRRPELDRLGAALAAAREGRPGAFLIAGEAGVGKTRFVGEVARRARESGFRVLEGGCVQVGLEGLPFGPILEALRGLPRGLSPAQLDELLGAGRPDLVRLMPDLAVRVGDSAGVELSDGSGQGRLFEHVLLLLERLAARAPLVVVIEDLHWADRSTMDLLGFLGRNLREGPILLIATYRSDELHRRHPLLPFLAEQERGGRAERLVLNRFDRAELAAQIRAILGSEPGLELIQRIEARSQGNAFYAEELLAAGASHGRLSETLQEVLLARVATLTEPSQDLVRVASAGGTRISPVVLARVTGTDQYDLEASLREAVARHILVGQEGAAEERYAFRHALVQEAVYADLLAGERTRLHVAFARALAGAEQSGPDASRAAELAYHWQAAQDLPRAFDAWIVAGLSAEKIYAFTEARANFERALDLWDRVPDAAERAPLDRIDLLMRTALLTEGPAPTRSVAYMRAAIALVDPAIDPRRAGLLHERLGQYSTSVTDFATAIVAYEEAVRLVPAQPPTAARAWVLSGMGACLALIDRAKESAAFCEEAISIARSVGAPEVESRALVALGPSTVLLGDVEAGLAMLRRAREIGAGASNVHEVARAMTWLAGVLYRLARYDAAVAAGMEAEAYAVRNGLASRWGTLAVAYLASALISLGRWDEAAAALARAPRYGLGDFFELWVGGLLLRLEALRGQFNSADHQAHGAQLLAGRFFEPVTAVALAELALWKGDPVAAREAIREAVSDFDSHPDSWLREFGWGFAAGIRAEADIATLARVQRSEVALREAQEAGSALLAQMRAVVEDVRARRAYCLSESVAWLATCEAEFSRLEDESDPDRWASAAALWDVLSTPYQGAYARMREAEATLGLRRDRPRAIRTLNEAHEIARRLGALPLREAIEALAARAGVTLGLHSAGSGHGSHEAGGLEAHGVYPAEGLWPSKPMPRGRYDLTPREREVLELLAVGRSDGEIAERLFISKKTASVHVATIKGKLGARSRVEIARDAIGLGIIEAPSRERTSPDPAV